MPAEPVVRIRCPTPEEAARCRALLAAAGHAPEEVLTWLQVREACPDAVNELLVRGGALGRTVPRELVGKVLGYLLDRQGDLAGRGPNLAQLLRRGLAEAGLSARWVPRDEAALVAAAGELHRELVATGAAFVPWERFRAALCAPAPASPAPAAAR